MIPLKIKKKIFDIQDQENNFRICNNGVFNNNNKELRKIAIKVNLDNLKIKQAYKIMICLAVNLILTPMIQVLIIFSRQVLKRNI